MQTKAIIKRVRASLREYRTKETEKKTYLNVLNTGVFVDLEKLKSIFLDVADSALNDFDKELRRRFSRQGSRHGSRH